MSCCTLNFDCSWGQMHYELINRWYPCKNFKKWYHLRVYIRTDSGRQRGRRARTHTHTYPRIYLHVQVQVRVKSSVLFAGANFFQCWGLQLRKFCTFHKGGKKFWFHGKYFMKQRPDVCLSSCFYFALLSQLELLIIPFILLLQLLTLKD